MCVSMEEAVSEDMTAHADRRTEGAVQKGARPAQTQQRQKQRQGEKNKRKKFTAKGQTSKVSSEF